MEKQEQTKPVRGQNLLEWYEALISAALVLVLIFSFFFRIIQVERLSSDSLRLSPITNTVPSGTL